MGCASSVWRGVMPSFCMLKTWGVPSMDVGVAVSLRGADGHVPLGRREDLVHQGGKASFMCRFLLSMSCSQWRAWICSGVMEGVWGVEGVRALEGVALAAGVRAAGVSSQRLRRLEADGVGVSWTRSEAARFVVGISAQPLGDQIYRLFHMKYTKRLNAT